MPRSCACVAENGGGTGLGGGRNAESVRRTRRPKPRGAALLYGCDTSMGYPRWHSPAFAQGALDRRGDACLEDVCAEAACMMPQCRSIEAGGIFLVMPDRLHEGLRALF